MSDNLVMASHEYLFPERILPTSPVGDVSTVLRGSFASLCGSFINLDKELSGNRGASVYLGEDGVQDMVPPIDFSEPELLAAVDSSILSV